MNTEQIARRLVDLCRKGEFGKAHDELYGEDCVSLEPEGSPWPPARGMAAIREKTKQFEATVETMHGVTVGDPIVAGSYFSLFMGIDMTQKGADRMKFDEIGLYRVRNGKIVSEQFFYDLR
jgi:ketosteroid isomerase-like protein